MDRNPTDGASEKPSRWRAVWFAIGVGSLCLGGIGLVMPVLPTAPFVILAAFAFGKSVPAVQRRLERSETFGPMIADWRAHGAIVRRVKLLAVAMMLATIAGSVALSAPVWVIVIQALCIAGAALFVCSRPDGPR